MKIPLTTGHGGGYAKSKRGGMRCDVVRKRPLAKEYAVKKSLVILLVALMALTLIVGCKKEPKVQTYTVTFESEGGSKVEAQKVVKGEKAKLPANPTQVGCGLLMWSKTKNGTEAFDFDTAITEDITLYAVWQKAYAIGDKGPGGGIIIYDVDADNNSGNADKLKSSECGWRFLETSTTTLNESEDIAVQYFSTNKSGSYGTKTGLGEGKSNTEKLTPSECPAAKLCADYSVKNDHGIIYDDWFLPSIEELKIVLNSGKVTLVQSTIYMSSSEAGAGNCHSCYYSPGFPIYDPNESGESFPVRSF